MSNSYFNFKQFTIRQEKSAFKVGTDGVLLGAYANISGSTSILDVGSGTGLISIMIAQRSDAFITAIEPDPDSYIQTCENAGNCSWSNRIVIEHTTLQNYYPAGKKFDLIVSNPPFFCHSLKNPNPKKSAARHNDTLTSADIIKGTLRLLEKNGQLQLIMPYVEGNMFIAEAAKFGLYCNKILKIKSLPTSTIRRLILTFSMIEKKTEESFLTIGRGNRHEFTDKYIDLTKDYYLKF